MPVPGFGYSVGDFFATIQLITKVIAAFKDGAGATEEYRQLRHELESLLNLLQYLETIRSAGNSNSTHMNGIRDVAIRCQKPLQEFLDKTSSRYGPLLDGNNQKRGGIHGATFQIRIAGKKAQWVFMEKEIAKLRGMIAANLTTIDMLLSMNQLYETLPPRRTWY